MNTRKDVCEVHQIVSHSKACYRLQFMHDFTYRQPIEQGKWSAKPRQSHFFNSFKSIILCISWIFWVSYSYEFCCVLCFFICQFQPNSLLSHNNWRRLKANKLFHQDMWSQLTTFKLLLMQCHRALQHIAICPLQGLSHWQFSLKQNMVCRKNCSCESCHAGTHLKTT